MITIIGQALVAGGLTGARPLLSLFVLAGVVRLEGRGMQPEVAWLVTPYALVALAVLTYVEHEMRTDPDFEEMLARPLQLLGALAAIVATRMLEPTGEEALTATANIGIGAGAAVGSFMVGELRRKLFEALDEALDVENWYARLEAGGVVGLLVAIVLLPLLAVGLLVVLAVVGTTVGFGLRKWRAARDLAARTKCPVCGHAIRVEASRCPGCKQTFAPRVRLA